MNNETEKIIERIDELEESLLNRINVIQATIVSIESGDLDLK